MCKVLNVSRSGLCAWIGRKESNRTHENREMTELIRSVFTIAARSMVRRACLGLYGIAALPVGGTVLRD